MVVVVEPLLVTGGDKRIYQHLFGPEPFTQSIVGVSARESHCRFHWICGGPPTTDLFDVYAIEDGVRGAVFDASLICRIRRLPPQGPRFESKLGLKPHTAVLRRVGKFLIASSDNNT